MIKLILFGLLCFLSNSLFAQWPKVYGNNTYDAIGRVLIITNDDGILIGGAERLTPNGEVTGYLLKTDINGNELWKRYLTQNPASTVIILGLSINDQDENGPIL